MPDERSFLSDDGPVSAIKKNTCSYLTQGRLIILSGRVFLCPLQLNNDLGGTKSAFFHAGSFSPAFFARKSDKNVLIYCSGQTQDFLRPKRAGRDRPGSI